MHIEQKRMNCKRAGFGQQGLQVPFIEKKHGSTAMRPFAKLLWTFVLISGSETARGISRCSDEDRLPQQSPEHKRNYRQYYLCYASVLLSLLCILSVERCPLHCLSVCI